jgi:phage baseplate assembly protein W
MTARQQGFTGISFPFRIGVKGGVATSSTNVREVPHIIESMRQILGTFRLERTMEFDIYSDIDADIFEPNDTSTHTLIEYQVKDCLRKHEPRIEVQRVDVTNQNNEVWVTIMFKVLAYNTSFITDIKVGDINVINSNS